MARFLLRDDQIPTAWFNALVAAVFAVLGLGMFDLLHIDLSRFGGSTSGAQTR